MKIWVIGKYKGLAVLGVILLIFSIFAVRGSETVTVSGKQRDLPIYCVDRGEEKVASFSFDAAWGNGIYGQCDIRH